GHERHRPGQFRLGPRALVLEPQHAAVAAADDQPRLAGAVPVGHHRVRVAVVDADLRARGAGLHGLAEGGLLLRPLGGHKPDGALDAAAQQVELARAAPVGRAYRRGRPELDDLAVLAFELPGRRVLALAQALEEVQFARPAAGEDVGDAVAVEVHKLWS